MRKLSGSTVYVAGPVVDDVRMSAAELTETLRICGARVVGSVVDTLDADSVEDEHERDAAFDADLKALVSASVVALCVPTEPGESFAVTLAKMAGIPLVEGWNVAASLTA